MWAPATTNGRGPSKPDQRHREIAKEVLCQPRPVRGCDAAPNYEESYGGHALKAGPSDQEFLRSSLLSVHFAALNWWRRFLKRFLKRSKKLKGSYCHFDLFMRVESMSDIAISVENVSKQYLAGQQLTMYLTLRDTLSAFARNWVDYIRGRQNISEQETKQFWALRDVSFKIRRGELMGIIGRNGAGKSTILKILGRITEPTEGRVQIRGRVGSLLEVGTGFHPEFTGRENVFLNGAILGMTRREIRNKFDEIVAFADVEKFLDTPVKHYSSGMYLRLAFATSVHLPTDILLVDEVLSVGDIEFQNKCLKKMHNLGESGKTILFVSHDLTSICTLYNRMLY